jgi:hypothetical protein
MFRKNWQEVDLEMEDIDELAKFENRLNPESIGPE